MATIFEKIAKQLDLAMKKHQMPNKNEDWNIFFHNHSYFDFSYFENFDYRGLHIIRDPRDIIVSGTFYHCKSVEEWLHIKRDKFGGLTYQEKINSYDRFEDKMLFEMDNASLKTITDIGSWNYSNPKFIDVKYENLIVDNNLFLFHKIHNFLGFTGGKIPKCLQISYDNSLFSGNVMKRPHIRSGKSKQWQQHFNQSHLEKFEALHGDLLLKLGYEDSSEWKRSFEKKKELVT